MRSSSRPNLLKRRCFSSSSRPSYSALPGNHIRAVTAIAATEWWLRRRARRSRELLNVIDCWITVVATKPGLPSFLISFFCLLLLTVFCSAPRHLFVSIGLDLCTPLSPSLCWRRSPTLEDQSCWLLLSFFSCCRCSCCSSCVVLVAQIEAGICVRDFMDRAHVTLYYDTIYQGLSQGLDEDENSAAWG